MPPKTTLTPTEAARILGLSEVDYVYRLLRTGVLAGRRVGRTWEVDAASVEQRGLRIEQQTKNKQEAAARREERRAAVRARFAPLPGVPRGPKP